MNSRLTKTARGTCFPAPVSATLRPPAVGHALFLSRVLGVPNREKKKKKKKRKNNLEKNKEKTKKKTKKKTNNVRESSGFVSRCGGIGPSTAFRANQAPVHCGCPAGTHTCDLVSRVRQDQSANPVVVWLGLESRVVRSSWRRGAFVH